MLNEKIQDAVVIEVSWNRLPVRNQRGRCGRTVYVTFRTWWKFFHNFPLAQGWWTDNDWNFILEETLLPAEQGTCYGAVVTGWFKKWYTSKLSVRAVAGLYLWMGAELKVHSLRMSFCLSTDTLLEAYTNTQSLLEELRLETVSRLLPKPVTRGNRNSAPSDPLKRKGKELRWLNQLSIIR